MRQCRGIVKTLLLQNGHVNLPDSDDDAAAGGARLCSEADAADLPGVDPTRPRSLRLRMLKRGCGLLSGLG